MRRVLLLSDIHGNQRALFAVLDDAAVKYPSACEMIFLGDLVDYGVNNNEVIDCMIGYHKAIGNIYGVLGNHDDLLLRGLYSYYHPKSKHDAEASKLTREITDPKLLWEFINLTGIDPNHRSKIAPSMGSTLMLHDENYITKDQYWEQIEMWSDASTPFTLLCGHNHIQGEKNVIINGVNFRIINPGSVGQPRDGDERAAYAALDIDNGKIVGVHFNRVMYDVNKESLSIYYKGGNSFIANRIKLGI